jgi:PmbA protein
MHPVIEQAQRSVDQAELYWNRTHSIAVRYENGQLQQVTENDLSETSLRVIKNGKLGVAYAVSPDHDRYLSHAVSAAEYGDPAQFSFAGEASYPALDSYDRAASQLKSSDLIGVCEAIKSRLHKRLPDAALRIGADRVVSELIVQTTNGADASAVSTDVSYYVGAPFKGAGVGVFQFDASVSPLGVNDRLLDEWAEWYEWGHRTSTPRTGRIPVLLVPQAAFLLMMPLLAGVSGETVWKKTSPLTERLGDRILSEKLTIHDDPLLPGSVDARAFDDEGVPCAKRTVVEGGVLKEFLFDQRVGAAMGRPSTGHGFKRALFGSGNETAINPWFCCPTIEPGEPSWRDLLRDMAEGLVITGGMGFHSGNYPQGQFAVQAVGFHVVDGLIVGRLDKTMISGNIYEDCRRIVDISRETGPCGGFLALGRAPYILLESLQVAGK